jgi:circadian clock protein KaiB
MKEIRLKLYVAGTSSRSRRAVRNLEELCDGELGGLVTVDIVDVLGQPALAEAARIFATPTLVKESPGPQRRIIGDLSERDAVLAWLDLLTDAPCAGKREGT